jgi:hypothetical protein
MGLKFSKLTRLEMRKLAPGRALGEHGNGVVTVVEHVVPRPPARWHGLNQCNRSTMTDDS